MSTDRLRASNRVNAKASTGPVTERGRAAVRSNALIHGFYSQTTLSFVEAADDFASILADYLADCAPAGAIETELVHRLVKDLWKARRLDAAEFALLNRGIQGHLTAAQTAGCGPEYSKVMAVRNAFEAQFATAPVAPIERFALLSDRLTRRIDKTTLLLARLQSDRLHSDRARALAEVAQTSPSAALGAEAAPAAKAADPLVGPSGAASSSDPVPRPAPDSAPPAAPPVAAKPAPKTKPPKNVTPPSPSKHSPNPQIGFVPHKPVSGLAESPKDGDKAA